MTDAPVTPEAVAAALEGVTPAPWTIYERKIPWSQPEHDVMGIPWPAQNGEHVEYLVGTEWTHPQLKGPMTVIGTATGIDAPSLLWLSEPDARFISWARNNIEALAADRDAQKARADAAEAKVAEYEEADGMKGAIVRAIRQLLNSHNVPGAAFIDDHVGNAIAQRDAAETALAAERAKMARLVEALTLAANRLSRRAVEYVPGSRLFIETGEWADEARAAIAEVQTNHTTMPTEYERKVAQMKEDFPNGI